MAAYCTVAGQCQGCSVGLSNCDGDNYNGCEKTGNCDTANCVPNDNGASSCGTGQHCSGQSCLACPGNTYNCDLNDSNACESARACPPKGNCVPNDNGAGTCGTGSYCSVQTCTPCNPGNHNCDLNDGNTCETHEACETTGDCLPNNSGASSCGHDHYCNNSMCTSCIGGVKNCDLNDGNMCESLVSCDERPPDYLNAHIVACQDEIYQINVDTTESTCTSGSLLLKITLRDSSGYISSLGRLYAILAQTALPANDGEAIATYMGEVVQSGSITVDAGSGLERTGSYQLTLSDGRKVVGGFRADECPYKSCQ